MNQSSSKYDNCYCNNADLNKNDHNFAYGNSAGYNFQQRIYCRHCYSCVDEPQTVARSDYANFQSSIIAKKSTKIEGVKTRPCVIDQKVYNLQTSKYHFVDNVAVVGQMSHCHKSHKAIAQSSDFAKTHATSSLDNNHVKRPMNGFMVFSQTRRKQLALLYPSMHNAAISKILGNEWKSMKQNDKQIYMLQALMLQKQHSIKHPGYKYRPKRRKSTKLSDGGKLPAVIPDQQTKRFCNKIENASKNTVGRLFEGLPYRTIFEDERHANEVQTMPDDGNYDPIPETQWYSCLKDIFDVDKEEFSQYFPKDV